MKFTLAFDQTKIVPAKRMALSKLSHNVTLKGFRPGKAPLDLVEQHLNPEKVIEETSAIILPKAYADYIAEHDLKPITQPRISLKKMVADGDWEFEVEIAERPEVKLNEYQTAVKSIKLKLEKDDKDANSKKLNAILETLLKTATIDMPEMLVEEEVNHSLSHLLEQVERLGLTVDQYLSSMNKTAEQLRADYEKAATDNLKLEFIIEAIARDQKFEAAEADVDKALEKTDAKVASQVRQNPTQLANLKYTLVKQKVIDFLMQL